MSKGKKKGGKARIARANPSPKKKKNKKLSDTPEFKTALGKSLLELLIGNASKAVNDKASAERAAANPDETEKEKIARLVAENKAAMQEQMTRESTSSAGMSRPSNPLLGPNTLNVRTPDGQQITWTFGEHTKESIPSKAQWWWYVPDTDLAVFANQDFELDAEFDSSSYTVKIVNHYVGFEIAPDIAKSLAEALLSAVDWERSYSRILNESYSHPDWADYDKKPSIRDEKEFDV